MLNVVLPWIIALVIVAVLAVVFRFWGEEHPRSDDPPDTGGEEPHLPPVRLGFGPAVSYPDSSLRRSSCRSIAARTRSRTFLLGS